MKYLNIILIIFSLAFGQIQYGGSPVYQPDGKAVKFITIDHSNLIEYDLHPMVLHYANEYAVDINVLEEATKVVDQYKTTFYLGIESPDAMSIGFHFDQFELTNHTEMFIYDEE